VEWWRGRGVGSAEILSIACDELADCVGNGKYTYLKPRRQN
jgi:hypothetical protein